MVNSTGIRTRKPTLARDCYWPKPAIHLISVNARFRCFADPVIYQACYPRRIKYVSMTHPCAARAACRSTRIRALTSASGPAMQICCGIPK